MLDTITRSFEKLQQLLFTKWMENAQKYGEIKFITKDEKTHYLESQLTSHAVKRFSEVISNKNEEK